MRLPDGKYKREIFHADPVDGRNHEDIWLASAYG